MLAVYACWVLVESGCVALDCMIHRRPQISVNMDGGIFILAALSDHTMKLIKISQLDSVLNILPSIEEAIDAVFMHEIEKDMKDGE